ncbi:phosphoglycerate mutase [Vibrio ponticus]|nr:phosphoglycerate mutase [Vibrio ponticus]
MMRHGETAWNQGQRLQGQLDSELTVSAKQQLAALKLPNVTSLNILTSTLGRAVQSAKLIADSHSNSQLLTSSLLNERHFGVLQGKKIELETTCPQWLQYHQRYSKPMQLEGAESEWQIEQRLYKARQLITKLCTEERKLLLVVHGEWWRAFDNLLHGREVWRQGNGIIANGELMRITLSCQNFMIYE